MPSNSRIPGPHLISVFTPRLGGNTGDDGNAATEPLDDPGKSANRRIPGHSVQGSCSYHGSGVYTCSVTPPFAGRYALAVRSLMPYGLMGEYFDNVFFSGIPSVTRVDANVNFNWGRGKITTTGADMVAVRWSGMIKPAASGTHVFAVDADDHIRLWVNYELLFDTFDCYSNGVKDTEKCRASGAISLTGGSYCEFRGFVGWAFRGGKASATDQNISPTDRTHPKTTSRSSIARSGDGRAAR